MSFRSLRDPCRDQGISECGITYSDYLKLLHEWWKIGCVLHKDHREDLSRVCDKAIHRAIESDQYSTMFVAQHAWGFRGVGLARLTLDSIICGPFLTLTGSPYGSGSTADAKLEVVSAVNIDKGALGETLLSQPTKFKHALRHMSPILCPVVNHGKSFMIRFDLLKENFTPLDRICDDTGGWSMTSNKVGIDIQSKAVDEINFERDESWQRRPLYVPFSWSSASPLRFDSTEFVPGTKDKLVSEAAGESGRIQRISMGQFSEEKLSAIYAGT